MNTVYLVVNNGLVLMHLASRDEATKRCAGRRLVVVMCDATNAPAVGSRI
jgi:hypothetical protein